MTEEPITPSQDDSTEQQGELEALRAKYERAQADLKKFRLRADEVEAAKRAEEDTRRQAELTIEQRARETEEKAQEAVAAAEERVRAAERRANLAGRVTNPERVIRLMDDPSAYFDGDTPKLEDILRDFPEYDTQKARAAPAPDSPNPVKSGSRALSPEDFRGKSPDWIKENLPRLKPPA